MSTEAKYGKILVVDANLFFVKRLTEALRQQGFEVMHCSEPAYALTMIEWNTPAAILSAMSFHGPNGFEIPSILRADAKTSHIPVIAIGDRGQQSQLEALRAGYEDLVDRRLGAEQIAAHLVSFLFSHRDGFQPTQMLARSETALDGRLSLVDLPGVIQVLEQSRQTGALHINAGATDGIMFFDAGEVIHAESGQLAGDDAIVHLIKSCNGVSDGVYKFIPGGGPTLRTVQGSLSGLILDALRDLDEQGRDGETGSDSPRGTEEPEQDTQTQIDVSPVSDNSEPGLTTGVDAKVLIEVSEIGATGEDNPFGVSNEQQSGPDEANDALRDLGNQVLSELTESDILGFWEGHASDLKIGKEDHHE